MVHTTVDGTFRQTNLTNESSEYLTKREELRLAEIELMRQRERVAELRRQLPEGALVQDYQFDEGPPDLKAGDTPVRTIRLSELFTKPNRSLIIYHLMYGKRQAKACPMCTAWVDGANGVAHHLAQNLDQLAVMLRDGQSSYPTRHLRVSTSGFREFGVFNESLLSTQQLSVIPVKSPFDV
jgi:predicted dithiol-disulfide oxidoreductase (DUF899 family)